MKRGGRDCPGFLDRGGRVRRGEHRRPKPGPGHAGDYRAPAHRRAMDVAPGRGRRIRESPVIGAMVVAALCLSSAAGAEVRFSISARETYVGMPVVIQVTIENPTAHEPPVVEEADGVTVRVDAGGTQSMTSIINGRVQRSQTITYQCVLTPRTAGTITLPGVKINVDGEWHESGSTTVVVKESYTGDLMYLHLVGDNDGVYVGEPIDMTLEVWLKPYSDRVVDMDAAGMWRQCVDAANSSWGPFTEVLERGEVRVRTDTRNDEQGRPQRYFVYMLRQVVWPERPGRFDASNISVVVQYPTRVERSRFGIFAPEYRVTSARPISAAVEDAAVQIQAPPSKGQPECYRGAVGNYTLKVSAAPTDVAVGDPITLTIRLSGAGRMELLQPPPIAAQSSLTDGFRVPDEALAGVVEQNVKTFTQSIRPKDDGIREIPPIEFAYFDPQSERYVTLRSDPIPIFVKESGRMAVSQVVEGSPLPSHRTTLTELEGMTTNYEIVDELLAQHRIMPGWRTWSFTAAMPLLYGVSVLVTRHRERVRGDTGFARRRHARRRALDGLRSVSVGGGDAATAVSAALLGYVADRCNLPHGGLTRSDAVTRLNDRGVADDLVREIDAVLAECEAARYAASVGGGESFSAKRARACIQQLERCRI
ncbi:MAG: hypothetical protein HOP29_13625 [Phycisphaerales bacterium]|nr:hypothetical protein [Phycisphaerales bacterium]